MQTAMQLAIEHYENLSAQGSNQAYVIAKFLKEKFLPLEKQQIIKTGLDCGSFIETEDMEQYYNETYGSKGSDENFKQFSLYEHKETITSADTKVSKTFLENTPTSSQTEISDEEIWKEGTKYADENTINDGYDLGVFKGLLSGFFDGAKWYREQLKSRQ